MTVNFLGLVGPVGVLPHVYTVHAASRARMKDTAFRDFLDLFHHRILSLFYQAWAKYRPAVAQELRQPDRFQDYLLDLSGLGTQSTRAQVPLPDATLAFYAGLLASRARPASGLAQLIEDYFEVTASVEQFVGEWSVVQTGGQCVLGGDDAESRLGWSVIGDEAWDAEARVRLRLGPLTREQYETFLPGGDAFCELQSLVRLYADDSVGVDAQLILAREEVAPCILGEAAQLGGRTMPKGGLGQATWLKTQPMTRDPDETVLRLC
jgi:type VI secretion system protein ImpH